MEQAKTEYLGTVRMQQEGYENGFWMAETCSFVRLVDNNKDNNKLADETPSKEGAGFLPARPNHRSTKVRGWGG